MRLTQLVALLFVLQPAYAQDDAVIALGEIYEKVRAGSRPPSTCPIQLRSPGMEVSPEECRNHRLVCIRIGNASSIDFNHVRVRYQDQSEDFGAIRSGELSGYRHIGCASRNNYAEAQSGERRFVHTIVGLNDRELLSSGLYTVRYRAIERSEPLSGEGWIVHGQLIEEIQTDESAP